MTMNTTIKHELCALALGLSIPACGLEASGPDTNDELQLTEREGELYSGEDLFLGIFFGRGEVATRMPMTWGDCSADARKRAIATMPPEVLLGEVERLLRDPAHEGVVPYLEAARDALAAGGVPRSDERAYRVIVELVRERNPAFFESLADAVYSGDRNSIADALRIGREILNDIILVDQNPFDPGQGQGTFVVVETVVAIVQYYVTVTVQDSIYVLVVGAELDQSVIFEELVVDEVATQFAVY